MVPALSLAVQVRGRRALISLYEGDAAEGVVRRFAEEHALTAEEAAEVLAAVRLKVQQSRMAPVLSLPVTVRDEAGGRDRELSFDLYEGDVLVRGRRCGARFILYNNAYDEQISVTTGR